MTRALPDLPDLDGLVVLFDIDGTLVTGPEGRPSAGLMSMNSAAAILTGVDDVGDPAEFAGRTDLQIARMLLEIAGETDPRPDRIRRLVDLYVEQLADLVEEAPYSALGSPRGVVPPLRRAGAAVGLGTGNVRPGAAIKLESAGIADLFDLEAGGFGEDGPDRARVLRAGVGRCSPRGADAVVVVGDTPRDVEAARAIGAACVGVPYRGNTAEVLERAGADAIAEGLGPDLCEIVAAVARPLLEEK